MPSPVSGAVPGDFVLISFRSYGGILILAWYTPALEWSPFPPNTVELHHCLE